MPERIEDVGGIPTWIRESPGDEPPVIFFHGNPSDADDWLPFSERLGRRSYAPDLPCFGRSPGTNGPFDASVEAYGRWASQLFDVLGHERYSLVVHDWGSVGLLAALAQPERIERVVAFNHVPFGVGYRWHWIARWFWRRRFLGEAANSTVRGPGPGLLLRQARPGWRPMPAEFVARVKRNLASPDARRAILALYRSAHPQRLDELGSGLVTFKAPTLLLWAREDPFIGTVYGERLAARLPEAELRLIDDAGHWAWLDQPGLVDQTIEFLDAA